MDNINIKKEKRVIKLMAIAIALVYDTLGGGV